MSIASHTVDGGLARRYARLSNDFNPIHLHPLLAKLFGLKTSLMHGMYNAHWSLSQLKLNEINASHTIEVVFKKPCYLPSQVVLKQLNDSEYGLYSADLLHQHLEIKMS